MVDITYNENMAFCGFGMVVSWYINLLLVVFCLCICVTSGQFLNFYLNREKDLLGLICGYVWLCGIFPRWPEFRGLWSRRGYVGPVAFLPLSRVGSFWSLNVLLRLPFRFTFVLLECMGTAILVLFGVGCELPCGVGVSS